MKALLQFANNAELNACFRFPAADLGHGGVPAGATP